MRPPASFARCSPDSTLRAFATCGRDRGCRRRRHLTTCCHPPEISSPFPSTGRSYVDRQPSDQAAREAALDEGARRGSTATPAPLLPDLRHMRTVPAYGRPPFAAGSACFGRRKLVRGALGMRALAAFARNLPPLRGRQSRKAATPLVSHASLHDVAKGTSPAGRSPAPHERRCGASRELQPVPGDLVIGL
jgi:hypothetical protein